MRTKPPHKRDASDDLAGAFAWHKVTSPQGVGPPAPPPPLVPAPLNVTTLAYATLVAAAGGNRTHTTHTLGEKMYQEAIDQMEVQLEAARELPSWAIALITTSLCLGGVLLWCLALCVLAPCVWGWRRDRDEPPPSADVELEEAEADPQRHKARMSDMDD